MEFILVLFRSTPLEFGLKEWFSDNIRARCIVTGPAIFGLVCTDIATRFVTCFSALGSRRLSRACPGKMASRPRLSARGKACRRGMRQHPARRLERDEFSFDFRRHCERSEAMTIRSNVIRV